VIPSLSSIPIRQSERPICDRQLTGIISAARHVAAHIHLRGPICLAYSQQYFSLTTNQPPATSHRYFSLRTNQHQPSATSQPNTLESSPRLPARKQARAFRLQASANTGRLRLDRRRRSRAAEQRRSPRAFSPAGRPAGALLPVHPGGGGDTLRPGAQPDVSAYRPARRDGWGPRHGIPCNGWKAR
jgi:hypothetical protein